MVKGKRKTTKKVIKPKKKKLNKRSNRKYPALDKTFNLKTRGELLDFDYVDKLNPKEKEWLNRFVEETVNASFPVKKKGTVSKKTGKKSKTVYNTNKALNKTKAKRKEIYDSNNARNRCVYTRNKAQGKLDYVEDLKISMEEELDENMEDRLINKIDEDNLLTEELNNFYDTSKDTDDNGDSTH
jgi:hypothetical protein